jgi:hypothetical protein
MGRAQQAIEVCVRAANEHREHEEALALYEAFLTGIASCVRARLVSRAMEGRDLRVSVGGVAFVTDRMPYFCDIVRLHGDRPEVLATIHGTPEDTAAEVVDTLLRLAAEWSER